MRKGVILVDFDNVFYGKATNVANLKNQLEDFVLASLAANGEIEDLLIRLYGGWKMNAAYTSEASVVLGCLEAVKSELFPYIRGGHRVTGDIELATSQYNLGIEWENTLQEKHGRHILKMKTSVERTCHHDLEHCPIHLVAKATRGYQVVCPLDGCEHLDITQLTRLEQKMVDSMMTCDILEYVHDDECEVVEVVSDDIDLHPALALAGSKYAVAQGVSLLLMVKNKKQSKQWERTLGTRNVTIRTWQ